MAKKKKRDVEEKHLWIVVVIFIYTYWNNKEVSPPVHLPEQHDIF